MRELTRPSARDTKFLILAVKHADTARASIVVVWQRSRTERETHLNLYDISQDLTALATYHPFDSA
jgi:hypothetical protein